MIYVVATVTLKPDRREHFLAEFNQVSADVRREVGCWDYFATSDIASGLARQGGLRADVVTILERWRDLSDLQAHSTAPHMLRFREKVKELVISTELQVLQAAPE
jgi:quinol monooxygenase YgiN